MSIKKSIKAVVAALALGMGGFATADVVVLDFEGIADQQAVGNYYASQNIFFSGPTLALIDKDDGGSGNTANEPSGKTVMFFLDANNAILTNSVGFSGGFSFFYSSQVAATVEVFAKGGISLGKINLDAQASDNCVGDPTGAFCNWTAGGLAFTGLAEFISFAGASDATAFDNITFGSNIPGSVCTVNCNPTGVPEPATLALVGAALLGISASRRRKA